MSDSAFYIPRYLDEPARFLVWTIDEAMAFFMPLFLGLLLNHIVFSLAGSAACIISLKKFKTWAGRYYRRWLYWHLPDKLNGLKNTPSSSVREYVG